LKSQNKFVLVLKDYPLAIFCAVIVLVCLSLIFLRGGTVAELTTKEADLNSRIRTINLNKKSAQGVGSQVEEVQRIVEQIKAQLFDREERAMNINFFYGLEKRLGVRMSNIGQLPAQNTMYAKGGARQLDLNSTVSYTLSLNGQFEDILIFLYELTRVERLIRVVDLEIFATQDRDETQASSLNLRIRLVALAEEN